MPPRFRLFGIGPAVRAALAAALDEDASLSDFEPEDSEVEGDLAVLPVPLLSDLLAARSRVKRLEQALADQRAEFQFLVHDLAGHALVVSANIDYLAMRADTFPAEAEGAIADSQVGAREVAAFVDAMLAVAQADEVGFRLKLAPVSLQPLIRDVAASFSRRAESLDVTVCVDVAESAAVLLDSKLFRRVVANLLANALRHAPRGSSVRVAVEDDSAALRVLVQNQGSPVPDAVSRRLFEKYSPRVDPDSPWRGGIGLHFCRRVVEAHGGSIELGQRSGWAVSIQITLPRSEPDTEGEAGSFAPVTHSGVHFRGGRAGGGRER